MKKAMLQKIILSALGIIVAVLLFLSPGLKIPVLDRATDNYFREAISKGGVSYAVCRVINASVSIIKESNLHLQPAGVGLSLAVGQALDPVDDLTERLSDILVTAITSLGVQKLAYEIGISLAPPVLAVFLFFFAVLIWFNSTRLVFLHKTVMRFALLIVIARFFLPLSSVANDFINTKFFTPQIDAVSKKLALDSKGFDQLKEFSLPNNGFFGTASLLKEKSGEFKKAFAVIANNMGGIIESLLQLTFLYVGILVIQVILLPLLAFFFLIKIVNALFDIHLPAEVLHHHMNHPSPGSEPEPKEIC
ncbi:ABC transmembrane type-1 domain-containing protein [Candidatus Electrothrix aarhusensis]